MLFADLHAAVLETLRSRVKNGQTTERGLARIVGISQPHMHNVLKGTRTLSPELSDQVLHHLRLSLLDLMDRERLARHLRGEHAEPAEYAYLAILRGKIGPGHVWPTGVDRYERFRIATAALSSKTNPVVAHLAEDVRMYPLFSDGDLALLDQGHRVRSHIDPNAYYVVKRGRVGLIRRLKYVSRTLYMFSDDDAENPAGWEQLPAGDHPVTFFVRARVTFVPNETEWH